MTYNTSSVNMSEGLHTLFIYTNSLTDGLFVSMFLFSFFCILSIGSFLASKRMTGQGDIWSSFATASVLTFILTILLSLIPSLVPPVTISIMLAVTILSVIALWLSK